MATALVVKAAAEHRVVILRTMPWSGRLRPKDDGDIQERRPDDVLFSRRRRVCVCLSCSVAVEVPADAASLAAARGGEGVDAAADAAKPPPTMMLTPCDKYPNCDECPMTLSTRPAPGPDPCRYCGARKMSLYDVPSEQLKVPEVAMCDFEKILSRSRISVATDELDRFVDWTAEFGQEG